MSAIGPAGEQQLRIAAVMNDRYHAFGRQGFGAIYGSKNLKAIVVAGTGEVAIARPDTFKAICKRITDEYKRDLGVMTSYVVYIVVLMTLWALLFATLLGGVFLPVAFLEHR